MSSQPFFLQIAIPTPLHRLFDYLPIPGEPADCYRPGIRVQVRFGRQAKAGIVMAILHQTQVPIEKLKAIEARLDSEPTLSAEQIDFARWIADYYQHPLGDVVFQMLPVWLRKGKDADVGEETYWRGTASGLALPAGVFRKSSLRKKLLQFMQAQPGGFAESPLRTQINGLSKLLQEFLQQNWIEKIRRPVEVPSCEHIPSIHQLNPSQEEAVQRILAEQGCYLLEGVTGSGKTEVYFCLMEKLLPLGKQVLLLVPEIGLTPQLITRVQERFLGKILVLHSGLTDRERYLAWKDAKEGLAQILIGTRSAIFTPLKNPGLIIVDEEHDQSYKQQDGFRYHARDLAVLRGKRENATVLLGSATPSLESIRNIDRKGYRGLTLELRAGGAKAPKIQLIDLRGTRIDEPLSTIMLGHIRRHLANDKQVLLFLNRRGFAPQIFCFDCGWAASCVRCDARMTYHLSRKRLVCHHCGYQERLPEQCGACGHASVQLMGAGTERVEQTLQVHFPDVEILRVDRDSTAKKNSFHELQAKVGNGKRQILVGTQMLAKGHHFPGVTMVGMVSVDQGLFGSDFRASEYMAQLVVQVAGRAGRGEDAGEVFIQTYHPDHPLLQSLIEKGYGNFARELLQERKLAEFPPFSRIALLQLESSKEQLGLAYLGKVHRYLNNPKSEATIFPPVPAPMQKRAGLYRTQLLLQSNSSANLHALLQRLVNHLEEDPESRKFRWSLDVDPVSLF